MQRTKSCKKKVDELDTEYPSFCLFNCGSSAFSNDFSVSTWPIPFFCLSTSAVSSEKSACGIHASCGSYQMSEGFVDVQHIRNVECSLRAQVVFLQFTSNDTSVVLQNRTQVLFCGRLNTHMGINSAQFPCAQHVPPKTSLLICLIGIVLRLISCTGKACRYPDRNRMLIDLSMM